PSTEPKVVAGDGPSREVLLRRQDTWRSSSGAPPEADRAAFAHQALDRLPPLLGPVVAAAEPSEAERARREVNVGPLEDGGRVRRERELQPLLVQLAIAQGSARRWCRRRV